MESITNEPEHKPAHVSPLTTSSSSSHPSTSNLSSSITDGTPATVTATPLDAQIKQEARTTTTCSIATQTEYRSIDHTLPLWSLSLAYFEEPSPVKKGRKQGRKKAAAASSSSSSSAATSSAAEDAPVFFLPPRKPFPLYSDVLQVIFRYLRPNDLLEVLHLSKMWYQSFRSANLGLVSKASAADLCRMPINSAFARQIAKATELPVAITASQNLVYPGFNILSHLGMMLPSLTSMDAFLIESGNYSLPLSLLTLNVTIDRPRNYIPLFESIRSLKRLKELQLHFDVVNPDTMDFTPLVPLTQLETLRLITRMRNAPVSSTSSFAFFVRQTRVKTLTIDLGTSSPVLARILDPAAASEPFPLMESGNLTSLNFGQTLLDSELLQVLINYPGLNQLSPSQFDLSMSDTKLLAKLPHVTTLTLLQDQNPIARVRTSIEVVLAACQNLPNLRKFAAKGWKFNNKQLDECLSYLPHLTDLQIVGSEACTTFLPLSKYGLPQRLKSLSVKNCLVPVADFKEYILPLKLIENLSLVEVCESDVPKEIEKLLLQMPNLKTSRLVLPAPIALRRKRTGEVKRKTAYSSESEDEFDQQKRRVTDSKLSISEKNNLSPKSRIKDRLFATPQPEKGQVEPRLRSLAGASSSSQLVLPLAAATIAPPAFDFSPSQAGISFAMGASSSPAKPKASSSLVSPSIVRKQPAHLFNNKSPEVNASFAATQSANGGSFSFSTPAATWASPEKSAAVVFQSDKPTFDDSAITNPFSSLSLGTPTSSSTAAHTFGATASSNAGIFGVIPPSFGAAAGLNALTEVALHSSAPSAHVFGSAAAPTATSDTNSTSK